MQLTRGPTNLVQVPLQTVAPSMAKAETQPSNSAGGATAPDTAAAAKPPGQTSTAAKATPIAAKPDPVQAPMATAIQQETAKPEPSTEAAAVLPTQQTSQVPLSKPVFLMGPDGNLLVPESYTYTSVQDANGVSYLKLTPGETGKTAGPPVTPADPTAVTPAPTPPFQVPVQPEPMEEEASAQPNPTDTQAQSTTPGTRLPFMDEDSKCRACHVKVGRTSDALRHHSVCQMYQIGCCPFQGCGTFKSTCKNLKSHFEKHHIAELSLPGVTVEGLLTQSLATVHPHLGPDGCELLSNSISIKGPISQVYPDLSVNDRFNRPLRKAFADLKGARGMQTAIREAAKTWSPPLLTASAQKRTHGETTDSDQPQPSVSQESIDSDPDVTLESEAPAKRTKGNDEGPESGYKLFSPIKTPLYSAAHNPHTATHYPPFGSYTPNPNPQLPEGLSVPISTRFPMSVATDLMLHLWLYRHGR